MTLILDDHSRLNVQSQVADYRLRGNVLESYSVVQFFSQTYEERLSRARNATIPSDGASARGRPANLRAPYLASHPKHTSTVRVRRSPNNNCLPNFVGKYFPRRDDPDSSAHDFYCASMLLLLKPWRSVDDLKLPNESWQASFERFIHAPDTSDDIPRLISNIQHFHRCESSVIEHALQEDPSLTESIIRSNLEADEDAEDEAAEEMAGAVGNDPETMLSQLLAEQLPGRERVHGAHAVAVGYEVGVFHEREHSWTVSATNATGGDLRQLQEWTDRMTALANASASVVDGDMNDNSPLARSGDSALDATVVPVSDLSDESLEALNPNDLLPDQRRAYDLVTRHLDRTVAGDNPNQLLMILVGEGGTGKSRVIQTMTEYFKAKSAGDMLQKAAYTGIAASLIDGKTTHIVGGINVNGRPLSAQKQKALAEFWRKKRYLIIDEFSMLAKELFSVLERNISAARAGQSSQDLPFGGLNVILCGDFHQFPPVSRRASSALYYPSDTTANESEDARTGRMLYEMFRTVVILRQQVRVTDPVWLGFLRNLRHGTVREEDVKMLDTLTLTNEHCIDKPDFDSPPWEDVFLVTPRHSVREAWNDEALRKHCQKNNKQIFICPAEDTVQGRALSIQERVAVAVQNGRRKRDRRKQLPEKVKIAVGMKVMVTLNLATDLDVANGARGVVTRIVLDPDEPPIPEQGVVELSRPPAFIVVHLDRTRMECLHGLQDGEIPIEPIEQTFNVEVEGADVERRRLKKTVHRRQLPITPAYAFTDYRSQGQTIPYVIVDIARPPSGKLSLFNLYVALSRSSGRDTIRVLREFDHHVFQMPHDEFLLTEDSRLDDLDAETKRAWEIVTNVRTSR